jgi:hypothetical protein
MTKNYCRFFSFMHCYYKFPQIKQNITTLTIFKSLFLVSAAPASCMRVPPLPDRLLGMAGITGITFFSFDTCRRINNTMKKQIAPIIILLKCTVKRDLKSRLHKIYLTYFISVCSILLRINTNIIINECPLSQHCFNII